MKTCVIFRGENLRDRHGYMSSLECVENWKETILDVIECDVVFITYPSEILDKLKELMKPIYVQTTGYDSQLSNASEAFRWMQENQEKYDRFVILRFDMMYRKKITDWHKWYDNGITIVNRDVHYPSMGFYADMVFVVDRYAVDTFVSSFHFTKIQRGLHHIGKELEHRGAPFHLMYEEYYHGVEHPLHVWHPVEKRPDLNNPYKGKRIEDLSIWN